MYLNTDFMHETNINQNIPFYHEFILDEKCFGIKLGWAGNGRPEAPFRRVDVQGVITSIMGMEGHRSIYKYEFKWEGGIFYTDNLQKKLLPVI